MQSHPLRSARHATLALLALCGVALSCHAPAPGTLTVSSAGIRLAVPAVPAHGAGLVAAKPRTSCDDATLVARVADELASARTGLSRRSVERLAATLVAESRARDLDPVLVLSVIQVESSFYNYAVSPVGAMGLMQLLPSTAEAMARRLGIVWQGHETLFDPVANVRLGIAYLAHLHERYERLHPALAAYNWGPTRLDRRLRSGAALPERYVRKVLAAWAERADLAAG